MTKTKQERKDAFDKVYDHFVAALEKGVIPWRKPWTPKDRRKAFGINHLPANWKSKKVYRGINTFLLGMAGYESRFWLTYKQANAAGGKVRKGEKSTTITFWKFVEIEDPEKVDANGNPKTRKVPFLRYFNVFNTDQCDWPDAMKAKIDEANGFVDVPEPEVEEEPEEGFVPIEAGETVVNGYFNAEGAPGFDTHPNDAFYQRNTDTVFVPAPEQFDSSDEYYATTYHEMAHSTGSPDRLQREKGVSHGDERYSKEELVAEMSAALLCDMTGMNHKTLDNAAAYIKHWLAKLREDKRMLVYAGAQAQKAVDFILEQVNEAPVKDTGVE